jgi:hypothetical protein
MKAMASPVEGLDPELGKELDQRQTSQLESRTEQANRLETPWGCNSTTPPSTPTTPAASVLNEELHSSSPLPLFEQLLTPPPAAPASLKVYRWRRWQQAASPPTPPAPAGEAHPRHLPVQPDLNHRGTQQPPAEDGAIVATSREGFIGNLVSNISALLPVHSIRVQGVRAATPYLLHEGAVALLGPELSFRLQT